jgi:hypothetical protein
MIQLFDPRDAALNARLRRPRPPKPHFLLMTDGNLLREFVQNCCQRFMVVGRVRSGQILPMRKPIIY